MAIQLAVMAEGAEGARENLPRRIALLQEELERLHERLEAFFSLFARPRAAAEVADLRQLIGELAFLLAAAGRKRRVAIQAPGAGGAMPIQGDLSRLRPALLGAGLLAIGAVAEGGGIELRLAEMGERICLSFVAADFDGGSLERLRALLAGQAQEVAALPDENGFSIAFPRYQAGF
jgi:hypothetical protein